MSIKKIDNYRIRLNQILGINGNTLMGYNNLSKEQVVIKILPKGQIAKKYKKSIESFKQEVRFIHKIRKNASYVVRYMNLLQTNNHFYIIQQFCKGGNLKKVLNEKKLNVAQAFKYMRHILKGFIELVKKGIQHGNLTPYNILLHNGLMRLSDFGLNANHGIDSVYAQIKNTIYLAPEVLSGKRYTYKSDIWSLGLIFYEMIYGFVPWKTGGFVKIYLQRLENQPLEFPCEPQVLDQIKNLIKGCLSVDSNKRYQWSQIYSNDVFNGQFSQMQTIDIKMGYILGDLRKQLCESNLDLERYFKSQNITNQTVLNWETFKNILLTIDQSLQMNSIEYVFNLLDNNQTGMIEFSEFRNLLQISQISLQFQPLRRRSKKMKDQFENKTNSQDILEVVIQKLLYQIEVNKIYDLCHHLIDSKTKNSSLIDFSQICAFLRRIQPKLNNDECRAIFKKIDLNNDGKFSYRQFVKNICVLTGSVYRYTV